MRRRNILFLCTHNSARSILGEAVASTLAGGFFAGYSAGAAPSGRVNPFAREVALLLGYEDAKLRSKSWDEFAGVGQPHMDIILTVCDAAAGEACPFWPGHPATGHWGFADPSRVEGSEADKRAAFWAVAEGLRIRLLRLAALDLDRLDQSVIKAALNEIHQTS